MSLPKKKRGKEYIYIYIYIGLGSREGLVASLLSSPRRPVVENVPCAPTAKPPMASGHGCLNRNHIHGFLGSYGILPRWMDHPCQPLVAGRLHHDTCDTCGIRAALWQQALAVRASERQSRAARRRETTVQHPIQRRAATKKHPHMSHNQNPVLKMVDTEPCKEKKAAAAICGWDCPLLNIIYPGVDCGSHHR